MIDAKFPIASAKPASLDSNGSNGVSRSDVRVWTEEIIIPTYLPAAPDLNPMFLEKRVYQGSSGKVYPLPFTDRIEETKTDRRWNAVWLENKFLRVMILPEIGGRIHVAQDKTNGYDFIYRQSVIKPALVGLAGPWISGGIEFNWPQHHRPATFLPTDMEIEEHADGSKTVWLSDHDPMSRMKGMHGVCLHPDKALIEVKARVYNRTTLPQSFLWWANIATRVHDAYQSFFPPDAFYVADHAKRATSEYPLCNGYYYGVNYGERSRAGVPKNEQPNRFLPPHCRIGTGDKSHDPFLNYSANDLSWYANIATPCSYMCTGTQENFFGGYDHAKEAGIVHVANHHISPGKKQWTWGNHEFGYAWDRNLTDNDGPYIELMAGVYTDNQPDFSFLQPGETKTWSQFLYPIQKIGPAHHANFEAAVHLKISGKQIRVGVSVAAEFPGAKIRLEGMRDGVLEWEADLAPGKSFVVDFSDPHISDLNPSRLSQKNGVRKIGVRVIARDGREIISYTPKPRVKAEVPMPATEPASPKTIRTNEELYLTGLHLEQYRHATRCPAIYWREALRRDASDSRCNNALGRWLLRRGEFVEAEKYFHAAIERLTSRNPNPYDGEVYYNLGLCLRHQLNQIQGRARQSSARRGRGFQDDGAQRTDEPEEFSALSQIDNRQLFDAAYAAFYKATWNQAWQSAGNFALAEMDCRRGDWSNALDHLNRSLRFNTDNLRARDLKAVVLRKLNRGDEAQLLLRETLALDPLDWWARHLSGEEITCDMQTRFDLALDFAAAGLYAEGVALLKREKSAAKTAELPTQNWGTAPLLHYYLGWFYENLGDKKSALNEFQQAAQHSPDYCFPSRLEEIAILQTAMRANARDARAPYYLGNLFYDRRRHAEAISLWEKSAKLNPAYSVVWRNLGVGYFNIGKQPNKARAAYEKAFRAKPTDARLLYERDQLWKRQGELPEKRLRELEKHSGLVQQRDDLSIELCALYNQTGRHAKALEIISRRRFQPWEGGEGQALAQHVRTHLALGREAIMHHDFPCACSHFETALTSPHNLSEAKHLLANQSDIHYWLGAACAVCNDNASAKEYWTIAANFRGDFQTMSVRNFSEMTYFSALAWQRLGQKKRAEELLRELLGYAKQLHKAPAEIDYFATSLPTMLIFEDDLKSRQQITALFLQAQAMLGLGQKANAKRLLFTVLKRDPNHALAADLVKEDFSKAKAAKSRQ